MKCNISLNRPMIASGEETTLDVLATFEADAEKSPRQPLNLSIVLDRSGSMGGTPLAHALKASKMLVDRLKDHDHISVVTYDDTVSVAVEPQTATDREGIKANISKIRAGGLTNLSGGWIKGCDLVKKQKKGLIHRVLLLTDGQANYGETQPSKLREIAEKQAKDGVITTTLGFGSYFNEDLLISIADAAGGNYYFIQSPEDAAEVFNIEVEGLASMAALELTARIETAPGVEVDEVLNNYTWKKQSDGVVEVQIGEVYTTEPRTLNFTLKVGAQKDGDAPLAKVSYSFKLLTEDGSTPQEGSLDLSVKVGDAAEAAALPSESAVVEHSSILRIGKGKQEAAAMADKGDQAGAAKHLQALASNLESLDTGSFQFAEELEQLRYFIEVFQKGQHSTSSRKEIKDQSYQARSRGRSDLQSRGISSGSTADLEAVTAAEGEEEGVVLKCVKEGGKLRVRPISGDFHSDFNVQFPRKIRRDGSRYLVAGLELAKGGSFYRAVGDIKLLLRPGETRPSESHSYSSRSSGTLRKSTAKTLADLEKTTEIGDGILIQIVKVKSKLRARVVSDGYDPNMNMRFPRAVRKEGYLFVVDEVRPSKDGSYYMSYGKIRYLEQPSV